MVFYLFTIIVSHFIVRLKHRDTLEFDRKCLWQIRLSLYLLIGKLDRNLSSGVWCVVLLKQSRIRQLCVWPRGGVGIIATSRKCKYDIVPRTTG